MRAPLPQAELAGGRWVSMERFDRQHPGLVDDESLGEHWGPGYDQAVRYRRCTGRDQGTLFAVAPAWNCVTIIASTFSLAQAQQAVRHACAGGGHHGRSLIELQSSIQSCQGPTHAIEAVL